MLACRPLDYSISALPSVDDGELSAAVVCAALIRLVRVYRTVKAIAHRLHAVLLDAFLLQVVHHYLCSLH